MNITYNIKLESSQEDLNKMVKVLEFHSSVWNTMSNFVFQDLRHHVNKKLIHDENYHSCRLLFPECPSQVVIRAKDDVYAAYKSIKSNKQLSKLEEPITKRNLSIRLDKRLYKFLDNNQIKLTTCDKRIILSYSPYPKFQELLSKYSMCDPLLFYKDNQLWLSVSFDLPEPIVIENSIIGVDLGINRFAVTSEGNVYQDKQFLKQKRKLRFLKRQLQSKTNNSHSAKTKLKKLRKKEQHKNKDLCHKVVNEILKTKSNIIVIENLKGIKKKNKGRKYNNKRSQVPFFQFREIIDYKAPLVGKQVVTVNPAYTSQDDYRHLERGIRKGCRYYTSDHLVFDADWNAAINIGLRSNRKLPVSFKVPLDGALNLPGRLLSTSQSCLRMQAPALARGC